jgi:ABC-type antimicrobial peptide transport system permease subunit
LIAYLVVQRTGEIGVRMALGAQRGEVTWMMMRRTLVWIGGGVGLGIPLALGTSGVAQNLVFGLSAADPGTLIGAAIMISAMGLAAGYLPARRATRVDPVIALRHD